MKSTIMIGKRMTLIAGLLLGCGEENTAVELVPDGAPVPDSTARASDAGAQRAVEEVEKPTRFCDFESRNAVLNGSFEYAPFESCGWSMHDTSDWGLRATLVCDDPEHDSCALQFEPRIWGNPWMAQLFQMVQVREDTEQLICFDAKSTDAERTLEVALIGAGEVATIGSGVPVTISTGWRTTCVPFMPTPWEESSVLVFAVSGSPTAFLLDNISLRLADLSAP